MNTPLIFINNDEEYSGYCSNNKKCCVAYDYNFIKGHEIKDKTLQPDKFPGDKENKNAIFFDNCGNLRITICNFKNCYTNDDFGGGLLVKQNCQVILHQTIFDTCHSKKHGAAGAIAEDLIVEEYVYNKDENDKRPHDPNHTCTIKIDIQYSCFQNCYTETDRGYGSALILGAQDVSLFYASTVDCPGQEKKTWGAQFDIMAKNSISSEFVNATGGNSHFCGSIEYRDANYGFFRFQTITQMHCKYATSFTSVNISGLTITSCNVHDNTLSNTNFDESQNSPSLVYVRLKNLLIENFYFYDNNFGNDGKFTSRDTSYTEHEVLITLSNCYANNNGDNKWNTDYVTTANCFFEDKLKETLHLALLFLGDCKGEATPGPMIVSSGFTLSNQFSNSDDFSYSKEFLATPKFTRSDYFSETGKFSKTEIFSQSNDFSKSEDFSKSSDFPGTSGFSKTKGFSETNEFSETNGFSSSNNFSPSKKFTPSDNPDRTKKFTQSMFFTKSFEFTKTDYFTLYNDFTSKFSNSIHFTDSGQLLPVVDKGLNAGEGGGKNQTGMIVGIVVGAVAAVAIIVALVAFFIWKKKHMIIDKDSADIVGGQESVVTVDNNLHSIMQEDDPFAAEFNAEN